MPFAASSLTASPRRLVAAILLFVALDMAVLVINLRIADQVAEDAVAINLAGRQRMLSQRMTKDLLLTVGATDPALATQARGEFLEAYALFGQTLSAFTFGGQTRGGDGETVMLAPVQGAGAEPVRQTRDLLSAIAAPVERARVDGSAPLNEVTNYMVRKNAEILSLMNALTSALEHNSVSRTRDLRHIQTSAFMVALLNFMVIVYSLLRRFRAAEREKSHWQEQARHDTLTGLTNRKGFFEAAERILNRAQHNGECGALILLDLDKFKPINDGLGHPTGDMVLRNFAELIRTIARQTDVVARIGGDEFVLLCPGLQHNADITHMCQRIVTAVDTIQPSSSPALRLGVSVGVATFPDDGYEIDSLIAHADRAMYSAKREGGNCWAHA